jgi:splicing factor 3A subunit 1
MAIGTTLNLPAPVNRDSADAGPSSSKAARVEDVDEITSESSTSAAKRYATGGIIYPPPELRGIVDKTAQYVARNGIEFEAKIRGDNASSTRLAFLNDEDAYHGYYRAKLEALTKGTGPLANAESGRGDSDAPQLDNDIAKVATNGEDTEQTPVEPEPYLFSADVPAISALDLDIVKLTALFVARHGRSFASSIAAREGRSYQFEFLKPSHSLFGFFNRLVEQYRMVLAPSDELLKQVRSGAFDDGNENLSPPIGMGRGGPRLRILEQIKARSEYEAYERSKRQQAQDEEEKERALFDEIDWQDFVVVGTIELTDADAHIDLPPPMSLREARGMSMAQKKMAVMIMERDAAGEQDATIDKEIADTNEERRSDTMMSNTQPDHIRPGEAEHTNGQTSPQHRAGIPIKVRKDYQPKTLAERKAQDSNQITICPVCGQAVPLSDMEEHVRIELANPRYGEQRREIENRRSQQNALAEGANPSASLRQFAGKRTDIFGGVAEEEAQRKREQEEARKRKDRETIVWDGHAASRTDTTNEFNRPDALQSDMAQIQKRFKTDQQKTYVGPQIGNEQGGPTQYAAPPVHMHGATMQQQPSVASMGTGPGASSVQHFGGMPQTAPAYGASHAYGHPQPPVQHHQQQQMPYVTYDQPQAHFNGGGMHQVQQPYYQQQQTLEKRGDGTLHNEQQWMQYHPQPIRVAIQMPNNPQLSDRCDGGLITFADMPIGTTIGGVRDRLQMETLDGKVGASRLKLRVDGKPTTLRQTLAHWNLLDGDVLTLQIT